MKKTDTTMRVKFKGHNGSTANVEAINLAHKLVRLSLFITEGFTGKVDIYQKGVEGFVINAKERVTVFKWGHFTGPKTTIEEIPPFAYQEGETVLKELTKEYPGFGINPQNK